jgi:hypothetical protein
MCVCVCVCVCVEDEEESREKSVYIFREGCVYGAIRLHRRARTVPSCCLLSRVSLPSPSRTDSFKLLHACTLGLLQYLHILLHQGFDSEIYPYLPLSTSMYPLNITDTAAAGKHKAREPSPHFRLSWNKPFMADHETRQEQNVESSRQADDIPILSPLWSQAVHATGWLDPLMTLDTEPPSGEADDAGINKEAFDLTQKGAARSPDTTKQPGPAFKTPTAMSPIELKDYQAQACATIIKDYRDGGRGMVQGLEMGTGKTIITLGKSQLVETTWVLTSNNYSCSCRGTQDTKGSASDHCTSQSDGSMGNRDYNTSTPSPQGLRLP